MKQQLPPAVSLEKTVFLLFSLKGKAHIERAGKDYLLDGNKIPKGTRYSIADGDFFWLEKGASADIAWIEKDGRIGKPKRIGRDYQEKTSYQKRYSQLTEEQYKTVRNLLSHSGNTKPLHNEKIPHLLLPFSDSPVRPACIPYYFWRGAGASAQNITVSYRKNDGDIPLSSQAGNLHDRGVITLNRATVIKELQTAYGEQGTWDKENIPLTLTLTTTDSKTYIVHDLNLVTDAKAMAYTSDFNALEHALKKPGQVIKLAEMCARLDIYPAELLHRLFEHLAHNPDAKDLFQNYCDLLKMEAEKFLSLPSKR